MAEPTVKIYSDDGLWIRELLFAKAGDCHAGHLHSHEHKTLIPRGSCLVVTVDGVSRRIDGPAVVKIAAMKVHDLTADHDGAMAYCVAPIADVVSPPRTLKEIP